MDIRKISIGPDYKSGAMHYLVGQKILGDTNGFKFTQHYWTSNEGFSGPATNAMRNFFGYFGVYAANKANLNSVRAVRKF